MKKTTVLSIKFLTILVLMACFNNACKKDNDAEKESEPEIVKDIDGNIYNTITVNGQVWMVENLKTTRYRNGDSIVHLKDPTTFYNFYEGAYCNYNNENNIAETYGRLYNWWVINDERKIAPEGWHVATDENWQSLVEYLGGLEVAGGKLKEVGLAHWNAPNADATNEVGFTALPGGYVSPGNDFENIGYYGYYWTSTNFAGQFDRAWIWIINNNFPSVMKINFRIDMAASIRCVKD